MSRVSGVGSRWLRSALTGALVLVVALLSAALVVALKLPGQAERLKRHHAREQLRAESAAIEDWRRIHGRLPDSLAELAGVPAMDPWGRPFRYTRMGERYALLLGGLDGEPTFEAGP
jgi:DNA-binding GntR family transcriptional regulator